MREDIEREVQYAAADSYRAIALAAPRGFRKLQNTILWAQAAARAGREDEFRRALHYSRTLTRDPSEPTLRILRPAHMQGLVDSAETLKRLAANREWSKEYDSRIQQLIDQLMRLHASVCERIDAGDQDAGDENNAGED